MAFRIHRSLCVLFAFFLIAGLACAQGDPGEDAQAWLKAIDQRLAPPAKLKALQFRFQPRLAPMRQGKDNEPAPFQVRYLWREGVGERIEWLDREGDASVELESLLGAGENESTLALARELALRAREFAQRMRGRTLEEEFSGWNGRVLRRRLAERDAITLEFQAKDPKRVQSVTIELGRDGLPWRKRRTFVNGDAIEGVEAYLEREGRYVLHTVHIREQPAGGMRQGRASALIFQWQLVRGQRLLSSFEVKGKDLQPHELGATEFFDVAIDGDVQSFEPHWP